MDDNYAMLGLARLGPIILVVICALFQAFPSESITIVGILSVIVIGVILGIALNAFLDWLNVNPISLILANAAIIGALNLIWKFRWELLNAIVLYAIIFVCWAILLGICSLIESHSNYYNNYKPFGWLILGLGAIATVWAIQKFFLYILIGICTPIAIAIAIAIVIAIDNALESDHDNYYYY